MPNIAFLTCTQDMINSCYDDHILFEELDKQKIPFEEKYWDDLTFKPERYSHIIIRTTWDYVKKIDLFTEKIKIFHQTSILLNPLSIIE